MDSVEVIATNNFLTELLKTDSDWMEIAIRLAEKAFSEKEVPVGSIVVYKNNIIGKGHNQTQRLKLSLIHI